MTLIEQVNNIIQGKEEPPFCKCGCGRRVSVGRWCKTKGIPEFVRGHGNTKYDQNRQYVLKILSGLEEFPYCKCGCGERVKINIKNGIYRVPDYLSGHHGRKSTKYYSQVKKILDGAEEVPLCKCGCGKHVTVSMIHATIGIPEYYGHHGELNSIENYTKISRIVNGDNIAPLCACGCGKRIQVNSKHHITRGIPEFIWGHSSKGENNPSWCGGISQEGYPNLFNCNLKEIIRDRDLRKCQLCAKTELENKKKLTVHHIDYNKDNCDPENLITVCSSCNSRVNKDRPMWTLFFQSMIKTIYEEIAYVS